MFNNLRLNCLVLLMAFLVGGCQSPGQKWSTASKDRAKSKSKSHAGTDELASRPSKTGKNAEPRTRRSDSSSELRSRGSDATKDAVQLAELLEKGDRLQKNGRFEEARLAYDRALSQSPNNPDVNQRLAVIADKLEQFSVADQHYQAALRVKPKDVNLLSDLGYSYSLRGNHKQAEQTLKQALKIDPTHRGAMANLGSIYAQQNRYAEAQAMFRLGCERETEVQQWISKLFPEKSDDSVAWSEENDVPAKSLSDRSRSDFEADPGKLSLQQLQPDIARQDPSEKTIPQRQDSWDTRDDEGDNPNTKQLVTSSVNSDRNIIQTTTRGQTDSSIIQVGGQTRDDPTEDHLPDPRSSTARQLAVRVGMNAGPGNLFPVLAMSHANDLSFDGVPMSRTQDLKENRFEGGFSPSTTTTNRVMSSERSLGGPSQPLPKATFDEGFDASEPKPAREPTVSRNDSWREDSQNSISWDSDVTNAVGKRPLFDTQEKRPVDSRQSLSVSPKLLSPTKSGTASPRDRQTTSRPYSGSWPNSNSIPARDEQVKSTNGPSLDDAESLTDKSGRGYASVPRYTGEATTRLPTRSVAQWPDAPQR